MPRYAFVGEHDQFPQVRERMEQEGIVLVSTCTADDVLNVTTESPIEYLEPLLVLLEV